MNNSSISIDRIEPEPEKELLPRLRAEESRLTLIIEAIQEVQKSKAWSTLKTEVFESLVNVLEKDLKNEARKEDPSLLKLTRVAGELKWAEKYSDLSKLEQLYRVQLQNIRTQLYAKPE